MLINKPCCDFKMCRNHFDGNCINTTEYERCSYNRQKAEIERLTVENLKMVASIKNLKSEAIKEFAEKLKENTIDVDVSYGYGKECYTEAVAVVEIDNLVKEMTEQTTFEKVEHNSLCETETYKGGV